MLERLEELAKMLTGVRQQLCMLRADRIGIDAVNTCRAIATSKIAPCEREAKSLVEYYKEAIKAAEAARAQANLRVQRTAEKKAAKATRNGKKKSPKKKRRSKRAVAV